MKELTYNAFSVMSVKARQTKVIEALENKGYKLDTAGRKDKAYSKLLTTFQKDVGLTPNGVVCEKTFEALGLS